MFTVLGEWWAEGKVISRGKSSLFGLGACLICHRYLGWHGICAERYRALRSIKELALKICGLYNILLCL